MGKKHAPSPQPSAAEPARQPAFTPLYTDPEGVPYLVGIGASAGGLEALERLFRAMPMDTGMAFVVIQHLSPDFKSLMGEQLERHTKMPVISVLDRATIEPNTVYLLPPKMDMVVAGHQLVCTERTGERVLNLPINSFFHSMAAEWGDKAIAIVLSGTGSDGTTGSMDVRAGGGLVIAQSEDSSRFSGMPHSAIASGSVDVVLPPEQIPDALISYKSNPIKNFELPAEQEQPEEGVPTIFARLKHAFDIDFNYYKPQTISRRIERRIALHPEHISVEEYSRRIMTDPSELNLLYKDLLIGVTRFFRDPEAFEALTKKVISKILENTSETDEVRVWDCGCSTGEEAYSIAILFLEAIEPLKVKPRLKVLATDLHRESLQYAAEGIYDASSFSEMPTTLRDKYFIEQADGSYKVTADLRKVLIFSEHNLLRDPPFTRIDLVSCRNLLIYFQNSGQMRALAFFLFSLKINSFLFLGPSEGLGELTKQFRTIDQHWKLYAKQRDDHLIAELRSPLPYAPARGLRSQGGRDFRMSRAYDALLARFIPSGILVNEQREALHVFGNASEYLNAPTGRVSNELFAMADGPLRSAMMTALRKSEQTRSAVTMKSILVHRNDQDILLNITVEPIPENQDSEPLSIILIEEQVVEPREPQAKPVRSLGPVEIDNLAASQIQHLELELQQTRESLQSTVEELETSNEELQSTNEELLAANEELQSTNEELHSVNEELYSVNSEHEQKILELNTATSNLNNLIGSTEIATIFLDEAGQIRLFTRRAMEIFPLVSRDIGRNLHDFKSILPDDTLFEDIKAVQANSGIQERQVGNSAGKTYLRRITPYNDANKKIAGLTLTYVDISEISRMQRSLEESKAQLRRNAQELNDLYDYAPAGYHSLGPDGKVLRANRTMLQWLGRGRDEVIGHLLTEFLTETSQQVFKASFPEFLKSGRLDNLEVELLNTEGEIRIVSISATANLDAAGKVITSRSVVHDITERKAAQDEIQRLAFFDALTGLPNRRLLISRLQRAVAASERHGRLGALLLVDLDRFKTVNDTLGHPEGDVLLQQVAVRISECVRDGDTVSRLGGDEFVVLLEDLSESEVDAAIQAKSISEKIHDSFRTPFLLSDGSHHCSASIGVALLGGELEREVEGPLKRADLALYQAKDLGRDTIRFFDPRMHTMVIERAVMEAEMREALEKQRFVLHYQPQVHAPNQITGAEALVRWSHPKRGLVPPLDFIPLAEETGLIVPLGEWILESACKQLTVWGAQLETAHLTISVNVSARQFRQDDFVDQVLSVLDRTGAAPDRLELELTESLLVDNIDGVIAKMTTLRNQGIRFSLDDFGKGFSSLSYLKRLPLDQIKIDKSFVDDILINSGDAAIARAIITLASDMKLAVIAEGVESKEQLDLLAALGCHDYQGYLFGKPMPIDDLKLF